MGALGGDCGGDCGGNFGGNFGGDCGGDCGGQRVGQRGRCCWTIKAWTLALALHTTGVLGRLFAEAIENSPQGPLVALRTQGIGSVRVFFYATLPMVLPQLISYTLYRWENNIRAAAVLGVVGAGGLGQLLMFHMSLFQMPKTATVLCAMLLLVAVVDATSYALRRALAR